MHRSRFAEKAAGIRVFIERDAHTEVFVHGAVRWNIRKDNFLQ